jgi:hypothetical protein
MSALAPGGWGGGGGWGKAVFIWDDTKNKLQCYMEKYRKHTVGEKNSKINIMVHFKRNQVQCNVYWSFGSNVAHWYQMWCLNVVHGAKMWCIRTNYGALDVVYSNRMWSSSCCGSCGSCGALKNNELGVVRRIEFIETIVCCTKGKQE